MKQLSPREIARAVATQSVGVSVKHGRTNGADVLHLIHRKLRRSDTIPADITAWNLHEWNTARPI
jgi:hypothetical protein